MQKRILTMQDLSCAGQCSLTVALPILSAYGIETCVLPTAILSNHTAFRSWSYLDLTQEIPNIFRHWKENGFRFEAFLLGYLGKSELMGLAEQCFDEFSEEGAQIIIDPVLGDYGKLYSGFDDRYVAAMRKLIRRADIILPNITEACFLTDTLYREDYDKEYVNELFVKLSELTDARVIITGVEFDDKIGEAIGNGEYVLHDLIPMKKHGTGDIFAAVFTAQILSGKSYAESCRIAGSFVADSIVKTAKSHDYGVFFETVLSDAHRF